MGKPKQYNWDLTDEDDYRLKQPFKNYCTKVRSVLTSEPITVGEIKRRLNGDLIDSWLADALEFLQMDGKAKTTEGEWLEKWKRADIKKVKEPPISFNNTMPTLFVKPDSIVRVK